MKRIVLCCDGTWNTPDQTSEGRRCQTNVAKVAAAVADRDAAGVEQLVLYHRGVGTARGERIRGGAFGVGLSRGVQGVYRFLVEHFEPGDEIFLFGFSRGSYMARSTAGLIRNAGILKAANVAQIPNAYSLYRARAVRPRDLESQLFRRSYAHPDPRIRFVGVWDTVGALGIPWSGVPAIDRLNRRWAFHDTQLSRIIDNAFHALAIDERRKPFLPAIWQQNPDAVDQTLEQVWFSGVHCDVGGGYPDTGLSDIALLWMVGRARACGLVFQPDAFAARDGGDADTQTATAPDPLGPLHDSSTGLYRVLPPGPRRIGAKPSAHESLASAAVHRATQDPTYAPPALTQALANKLRVTSVG
ncbi:MAG: DUF2235 domain-containing protein [Candidatus Nanopelagicales bacterium]|nr:DUF2235 domain-containing protein [Candidatus Nanopelagicales bacterium]